MLPQSMVGHLTRGKSRSWLKLRERDPSISLVNPKVNQGVSNFLGCDRRTLMIFLSFEWNK